MLLCLHKYISFSLVRFNRSYLHVESTYLWTTSLKSYTGNNDISAPCNFDILRDFVIQHDFFPREVTWNKSIVNYFVFQPTFCRFQYNYSLPRGYFPTCSDRNHLRRFLILGDSQGKRYYEAFVGMVQDWGFECAIVKKEEKRADAKYFSTGTRIREDDIVAHNRDCNKCRSTTLRCEHKATKVSRARETGDGSTTQLNAAYALYNVPDTQIDALNDKQNATKDPQLDAANDIQNAQLDTSRSAAMRNTHKETPLMQTSRKEQRHKQQDIKNSPSDAVLATKMIIQIEFIVMEHYLDTELHTYRSTKSENEHRCPSPPLVCEVSDTTQEMIFGEYLQDNYPDVIFLFGNNHFRKHAAYKSEMAIHNLAKIIDHYKPDSTKLIWLTTVGEYDPKKPEVWQNILLDGKYTVDERVSMLNQAVFAALKPLVGKRRRNFLPFWDIA